MQTAVDSGVFIAISSGNSFEDACTLGYGGVVEGAPGVGASERSTDEPLWDRTVTKSQQLYAEI